MEKSSAVVIGLGRFGSSLARTLSSRGYEVLGLDVDMKTIEAAADYVTQATQVDATDESSLAELGVGDFDIGVVGIGEDIKSSVMIALLLEKLGVKRVVAKAYDELHGEILTRIGVDTVVYPERDTGVRVAHTMMIPIAMDYLEVMPGFGLAKITVPESFTGTNLSDIDFKGRFNVSVLVLRRGKEAFVNPSKFERIAKGDTLIIAGRDEDLEAIRAIA